MPTREITIPTGQGSAWADGRRFPSSRSRDLEARCRRQSLDIDRLTAALATFRRRIAALEATNAQLRAENAQLRR